MHVATGALGGLLAGSRARAAVVGPVLHFLGDRVPHEDVASHRFETVCGVGGALALAIVRGPLDPATIGAVTSAAPDLEHVLRLPRPGGRKLFPSHRITGWHRPGGLSTNVQLLTAGALFGAVLATRGRPRRRSARSAGRRSSPA
jgi:hypothetical protein